MLENKLDYTNTFYNLTYSDIKINTSQNQNLIYGKMIGINLLKTFIIS